MQTDMVTVKAVAQFDSRSMDVQQLEECESIKLMAAKLFDLIDNISIEPGNQHQGRMISIAKTKLEEVVMWAVKGVSRK